MAKIEVPDSMVPEGWELTGEYRRPKEGEYINILDPNTRQPKAERINFNYDCCLHAILRRKPRLKRIVFTVAGEAKRLGYGDFFLDDGNKVGQWLEVRMSCCKYIPLTRTEEFE